MIAKKEKVRPNRILARYNKRRHNQWAADKAAAEEAAEAEAEAMAMAMAMAGTHLPERTSPSELSREHFPVSTFQNTLSGEKCRTHTFQNAPSLAVLPDTKPLKAMLVTGAVMHATADVCLTWLETGWTQRVFMRVCACVPVRPRRSPRVSTAGVKLKQVCERGGLDYPERHPMPQEVSVARGSSIL